MKTSAPTVVIALQLAYRDCMDKFNGIMRYLRETGTEWDVHMVREPMCLVPFWRGLSASVSGVISSETGYVEDNPGDNPDYALPKECLKACRERNIPMVGLDWPLEALARLRTPRCSFFNVDSPEIGAFAAETFLKASEYASYGYVGLFARDAWSRSRGTAFAHGLRKAGRRNVKVFGGDALTDKAELLDWLKALRRPTAIFAANDWTAHIVQTVCLRNGLHVPDDVAILGVDDDPVYCVHTSPTLSSVHPNFEKMGYLAAEELSRLMSGRSTGGKFTVGGGLSVVDRMSTAPCSPAGILVRQVDEMIAARACDDINSDLIAAELKVSRRLLDLRYRQLTGLSIRKAIVRTRVARARCLLVNSAHPIETVSRMCGYRTASYLGKVFLAEEGMTMSDYRNLRRV